MAADRLGIPRRLLVASLSLWICSYLVLTGFMFWALAEPLDFVHIKRAFLTFLGAAIYCALFMKLQPSALETPSRRLGVLLLTTVSASLVLWLVRVGIDAAYVGDPLNPVEDAQWVFVWLILFLAWIGVGTALWGTEVLPGARTQAFMHKALSRVLPDARDSRRSDSIAWCDARAESFDAWASQRHRELWDEALSFAAKLEADARRWVHLPGYVGGGSAIAFLYFLTRWLRPQFVLETGVAAGWSSTAFLSAMHRNGMGRLFSSDLPYFGHRDALGVIGTLVPPELRGRWQLYIDGDRSNLPRIFANIAQFDIVHYDSDKTYGGRDYFCRCFKPQQVARMLWLFDDIEDNMHFRDWVTQQGLRSHVFFYDGKYIGLAASPALYASLSA